MKNYIRIIIALLILPFLSGCLEDPEVSIVHIKTIDAIEYVKGGIVLQGEIKAENENRNSLVSLGFCYSEEKNPTVSDLVNLSIERKWGDFSVTLTSLKEDTKYYARAFASNSYGVVYGDEISFISLTRPKVSTLEVSENDNHELLVSCELLSLGTGDVDLLGICYSIDNSEPILEKDSVKVISTIKKGKYEISYSIKPDSKYYVRAVARNIAGVSYGPVKEILTKKPTYTITFDSNDGTSQTHSMKVNSMETNILPENTFVREGYTFIGWNTEADGSGVSYYDKQSITLNNNITLYAQWRPNSHMIIFKSNGASGNMPSVEIKYNNSYTIPSNTFTYTGYTFIGWNTSTDGTGITYYEDQTITIKGDLTLYAQWEKKSYNITFYSNGGSGSMQSEQKNHQDSYILQSNKFTNTGHTFVGWNTKADGTGTSYYVGQTITISNDLTLYAQWKKIEEEQEQVSGSHQGHDYVDLGLPSGTLWATCNVGASRPEGYGDYFAWGETETKSSYTSSNYTYYNNSEVLPLTYDAANVNWGGDWRMPTKVEQDELRNASYTTWTWIYRNGVGGYMVSSKINGNSIFLPAAGYRNESNLYRAGSDGYYLTSSLNTSYLHLTYVLHFSSSRVDLVSTDRYFGRSVRAVLPHNTSVKPDQPYTIIFNANGGTGSMSSKTVSAGNSIVLPANTFTYTGYEFVGWNTSSDGTGISYTNGQSITPLGNITLYAQWNKKEVYYTITFNANGGSGSMSSMTVNASSSVSLPSNKFTQSGYSFTGWNTEVDGSGVFYTNGQSLTLSDDLTLYAQWKRYVSTITFDANDGSGESSSIDVSRSEKVILLNKFVRDGYVFLNWNTEADGSGLSYENAEEIMVAGNLILYAQWRKYDTPTVTTSNVTDITNNSASCGGSIISLDYEIIERGICYSSSSTPTISNYVIKSGEGVGAFTCSLTGLSSGTTYYVRAYAKYASDVVVYGETKTFKTFKVPTLSSPSITEKEDGTVVCGSSVSTIGYNVTERGICYATYSTPTTSSTLVKSTTNGTGSFECILINLVAGTTYYVRAYAKYDNGNVAYSSTISFITHKSPQVTTSTVSNISSTSAICGGTITSPDYSIQERGICYSKTSTPTISNSVIKGGAGTGTFNCTLTGLSSGSIYYVRAYAKYADDKVIYGETRSFTTQRIPVISSFTISNIGETSADCNAYVNSYDYTITERGFCYSTYSNPTINDYKVSSSSGNGTYTGILSSLNRNTTYYVRAYAVYNGNIIYSDVKSFKTFYTLKLTTLEVTDITEDYVVLEGEIICPGMTISKRGFDYWTSTNPKVNTISCGSGEGEFGIKWEFFMANTTYYVRAYAIIDGIKSYGNTQMFNTLPTNIDYPNGSKLYFINTAGWENVYAYVWKERGISSGTSGIDLGVIPWPGKPATYEGTFRGYKIYSYDIVGLDVNSIIFSQPERYQTEDLEIDLYKIYYYLGEWYESINDIP